MAGDTAGDDCIRVTAAARSQRTAEATKRDSGTVGFQVGGTRDTAALLGDVRLTRRGDSDSEIRSLLD